MYNFLLGSRYTEYAMGRMIWCLNPRRGKRFFSSPNHPNRPSPHELLQVSTGVLTKEVKQAEA